MACASSTRTSSSRSTTIAGSKAGDYLLSVSHTLTEAQVAGTFAGKKKLYNENEAINAAGGGQDTMEMIEIMFKEGQIFCNSGKETKIIEDI